MTAGQTQIHKRRRWRRVVLLAVLLLLCGAVVNVIVAWIAAAVLDLELSPFELSKEGPAYTYPPGECTVLIVRRRGGVLLVIEPDDVLEISEEMLFGGVHFPRRAPMVPRPAHGAVEKLPYWSGLRGHDPFTHSGVEPPATLWEVKAYGFPLPCLGYTTISREYLYADRSERVRGVSTGIQFDANGGSTPRELVMPTGVHVGAFVTDCVFWSIAVYLVALPRRVLRRWRRRRRGLCVGCGYDLRGNLTTLSGVVCPECGRRCEIGSAGAKPAGRPEKHNDKLKRKRWRRVALLTLVLLIGGTVLNVGVAWACILWAPWPVWGRYPKNETTQREPWRLPTPADWPRTAWVFRTSNWAITEVLGRDMDSGFSFDQDLTKAGVPMRAFGRVKQLREPYPTSNYVPPERRTPRTWREGWLLPGRLGEIQNQDPRRDLPLIPLWPGFAINTVFYAGLLWLPIRGPFVVRRWRRERRGLCVVCGYDLRGSLTTTSSVCPECGAGLC